MPVLGITGGIATGKTSFTQALTLALHGEVFDADACAHDLLARDATVRESVREHLGNRIFDETGQINRATLRTIVFEDERQRSWLEAILHPMIRERWLKLAATFSQKTQWLFVDIPLLFETAAEKYFTTVVVVACSDATQRQRLACARQIPDHLAEKIIAVQMPLAQKINRANHLIWNEGSAGSLATQAALFGNYLTARYG